MPQSIPADLTASCPCFYNISTDEAYLLLMNEAFGTYLFCNSNLNNSNMQKSIYICCLMAGFNQPDHLLIEKNSGKYLLWQTEGDNYTKIGTPFESFDSYIIAHQQEIPVLKVYSYFVAKKVKSDSTDLNPILQKIILRDDYADLNDNDARALLNSNELPIGSYFFTEYYDKNGNIRKDYLNFYVKVQAASAEKTNTLGGGYKVLTAEIYI